MHFILVLFLMLEVSMIELKVTLRCKAWRELQFSLYTFANLIQASELHSVLTLCKSIMQVHEKY